MAQPTEEQRQLLEVAEGVEVGLKGMATVDLSPGNEHAAIVNPREVADGNSESSENGGHFDTNRDPGASSERGISDILKFDDGEVTESRASEVETGESSKAVGEVVEEEIVELEFEKVKPKLTTHSMHCPNCRSEITKVILRRKVIKHHLPEPINQPDDQQDLVGCFSCLSLFTCSENGCFNPFEIFRKRPDPTIVTASPPGSDESAKLLVREKDNCFSMLWVFGKKQNDPKPENPLEAESIYEPGTSDPPQSPKYVSGTTPIGKGHYTVASSDASEYTGVDDHSESTKKLTVASREPSSVLPSSSNVAGYPDSAILDLPEPDFAAAVDAQPTGRSWLGYEGVLAEILKSIVYGGLMEVIASLSVVASAAASDAATLSIVGLALASVIGGIFMIGHNLWDLRNDCYKENSSEATNKYEELLGRVKYFPLHAVFTILSFLVFGMIPPVAYGFSFRETNDKDFTIVVVATASLLCVALLAIFKAYINKCTFFEYFKTVVYYMTSAVSVSGVSYVAGNLATRLMEELGLFDTSSGGGMSTTPSLASF